MVPCGPPLPLLICLPRFICRGPSSARFSLGLRWDVSQHVPLLGSCPNSRFFPHPVPCVVFICSSWWRGRGGGVGGQGGRVALSPGSGHGFPKGRNRPEGRAVGGKPELTTPPSLLPPFASILEILLPECGPRTPVVPTCVRPGLPALSSGSSALLESPVCYLTGTD